MALKKEKTLNTGAVADYWRIAQININYNRPDVIVTLEVYKSKADRLAGLSPFESVQFDIVEFLQSTATEEILKNITLQKAYTTIKKMANDELAKPPEIRNMALAWFADATDD